MSGFEMLPRAKEGQPIFAEDWNALVAAIEGLMQSMTAGSQGFIRNLAGTFLTPDVVPDSPAIVRVLNTTGAGLNRFSVVGLGDLVDTPTNAPDGFQEMPVLIGETPTEDDHTGNFAILLESIGDDSVGKAVIAGAIFCTINVSDASHKFADVSEGETDFLKSASSGMARILWRETGTGQKEAYVRLGGGSGGSDIIEGFLTSDLAASTGNGTGETTATMDVWSGDGAAWASTGSTETVTNRDDSLSGTSGAFIQARRAGSEWRPIWLACSTQNEIQRLSITGNPTGGSITVSYEGEEAIIPFDSTANGVYLLLTALSSVGTGNLDCTGGDLPGTPVDIEFINDLANTDVPMLLIVENNLTGGTAPDATITLVQSGCCG